MQLWFVFAAIGSKYNDTPKWFSRNTFCNDASKGHLWVSHKALVIFKMFWGMQKVWERIEIGLFMVETAF